VKRVAVIGNGGGGKTTLCLRLGDALGLPVHEVDQVQFGPDWSRTPVDEFARAVDRWVEEEAWVIDGFGPWPSIERRLAVADTVVWVDFPLRTHLRWALKRQLFWQTTPDGRRRPPTREMIRTILAVHRRMRPRIEAAVRREPGKLVHLRSPRALRNFLEDAGAER
jgi:adenylate kinase family enzyme